MQAHFILYVWDQKLSKSFYQRLHGAEPTFDVDGMAENWIEPT